MDTRRINGWLDLQASSLIYLIGPSGAGKSTLGKKWAKHLNLPFIDLDLAIESKAQLTIPDIFEQFGELHFRNLESQVLRSISHGLVACGAGAPCFEDNMHFMIQNGSVVWIQLSPEMAWSRVANATNRPLVQKGKESFIQLMKDRERFYDQAHHIYSTTK